MASWPRHVRRVRWTKATNAPPTMATLQQPLNLEAAHEIVRPRPRAVAATAAGSGGNQPELARHQPPQQLLPQLWQKEQTAPVGLLPQMRIPGRYALAMKPSRDVCQLRLRAVH